MITFDLEAEIFDPTSTSICIANPALQSLQHFWITDSLIHRGPVGILPLFSNCTIKKLELLDYILWGEFVSLTKAETIESLKIKGVFGDETLYASVEKVIACVPNATSIEISESFFTPTTLVSLGHKVKLSNFVLHNITSFEGWKMPIIDDFFGNNADFDCSVHFDVQLPPEDVTLPEVHEYNEAMANMADAYIIYIDRFLALTKAETLDLKN
uniref:Uncharacterized protein n=1 Tax=Panagrolaimus davidi TaxID=227884 RepID=A0A914QLP3_9BILA